MKRFLLIFAALFLTFATHAGAASSQCESCMAECPHATRDLKDCDRGCPGVCKDDDISKIRKERICRSCLTQCPHNSRDIKPCDLGCTKACDRDSLYEILRKNVDKKGCELDREKAPAQAARARVRPVRREASEENNNGDSAN